MDKAKARNLSNFWFGVLQILLQELFNHIHVLLEAYGLAVEKKQEEVAGNLSTHLWALVLCLVKHF